jgi:tungstate transport system ATP-binding protein
MSSDERQVLYRLRDIRKSYTPGPFTLHVPELDIPQHASIGLVGPNGSGKSTLLHILGLMEIPDSGLMTIMGAPPYTRGIRGAGIAILPQAASLLKRSVYENVAYGLRVRGSKHRLRPQVFRALGQVGLDPDLFAPRKWRQLSGGEAQRVALAARLAVRPCVLLMDEPTASVDQASAELIRETIQTIHREQSTALVIASHDHGWLQGVCDRTYKMHEGRIVGLYSDNLIAGPWETRPEGIAVRKLSDGQLLISLPPPRKDASALLSPSSIMVSTCRPDHLSARNVLRGRLTSMSEEAAAQGVRLDIRVADLNLTCQVTLDAAADLGLVPGTDLWVVFKASSLRWF